LSRALVALLVAGTSGSCQEPIATDFTIRFALDSTPGSLCAETDCEAYPMRCGARLSVRIFDTQENNSARGVLIDQTCETVATAVDLCDLKNTTQTRTISFVPLHHVRIEVAAWRPADVEGSGCPDVTFDATGRPRVEFRPRPAVAGAAPFDVSSSKVEVLVPLQCTDVARLDDDQCQAEPTTLLRARVDDMANGFAVPRSQAEGLDVNAAPPTLVDGSGTVPRIDMDDYIGLTRVIEGSLPPSFVHEYPGLLGGNLCTVVRDSGPQVTATATCDVFEMGVSTIDLRRGILVTTDTLQPILDAMGTEFPETGLVVGRVLSPSSTPLGGVQVRPSQGTVEYLDEARTGFSGTTTSSHGYFISRDASFDTTWRASGLNLVEQSSEMAGLVNGMLSPIIIRMVDPNAPLPVDDGDGVP
jgi:hypothetical protein